MKINKTSSMIISFLMIICLSLILVTGCSSNSRPADVIARYEKANNDRDLQALMDCMDPDAVKFFGEVGKGLSSVLGGPSVDTEAMLPFMSQALQAYVEKNDVYPRVKLTATSTKMINDKKATVEYTETLIFPDGTEETYERSTNVIKNGKKWYISFF